jgi:hypothetical protein
LSPCWFSTKILRRGELSDVVIESADAREQRVGADRATRIFRKLAHRVRMLIGARRAQCELAQHRQVGV